jgi:hypothetical protein
MSKILQLQTLVKSQDHFEMLERLAVKLIASGKTLAAFNDSIEGLSQKRAKFASLIVYADLLIELCRIKLSIMGNEWNEEMDKAMDILINEYAPDFSDEEF